MNSEEQSYPHDEETLVNWASKGNLDAFNELVLTYQNLAYHHVYALLGILHSLRTLPRTALSVPFRIWLDFVVVPFVRGYSK
jgi:hypothetical protein